jgi:hypothetical protein
MAINTVAAEAPPGAHERSVTVMIAMDRGVSRSQADQMGQAGGRPVGVSRVVIARSFRRHSGGMSGCHVPAEAR